jgi:HAD superfamily phosphatase (TIGR01668 family)
MRGDRMIRSSMGKTGSYANGVTGVLRHLVPDKQVPSIYDIDLDALQKSGIRGVITDLDNTLVAWNSPQATPKLVDWLDDLRQRGLKVCIVSNNRTTRVRDFAEPLAIPFIGNAGKPRHRAFLKALEIMGTSRGETVVVGDQLFTDIAGGKRMGMKTIMVLPVGKREWFGTKILRALERVAIRYMRWRGWMTWEDGKES